jgi:AcrR family transcriptional regulator
MVRGVNPRSDQLRAQRVAATEQRLVDAAARLFTENGYVATTLTAVAAAAGVAPRTVYLRFDTKVALFRRTMDVMLVGDSEPVDVAHREWMQRAFTAPTRAERIHLMARATGEMFSRIGPLLAVSEQAAALEPEIAAAAQAVMTCSADAYLLAKRTLGWSAHTYAHWLETTWLRASDASGR